MPQLRYDDDRVRLYYGDARDLLDDSDPDGLVIDPFAGSAATLLAAQRTDRRAIGV